MIEHMDRRIGDVLQALEDIGATDNTVVIFASDNGGTRSARNVPLSGSKGTTWEGGIRVPGMIRWPGQIPAGTISEQPCITFDFTRSIAELAGVKGQPDKPFEGIDIIQHVVDQEEDLDRTLYWRKQRGDRVWKGVREGSFKYVAEAAGGSEQLHLFDLSNDIAESNDLKQTHAAEFHRLHQKYNQWEANVRANRRGRPEKQTP